MTIRLKPNGKLNIAPVERLTPDLRQRILDNRPAVVAALQASTRTITTAAADADELTSLVRLCGERYHFTDAEHVEALQIALADPVAALTCFRAIAREVAPPPTIGDSTMSKSIVPPEIQQREKAFKAKVAGQKAQPLGAIPSPSKPVPTVQMPRIINPMKGKK
jgi:hypothetical protein